MYEVEMKFRDVDPKAFKQRILQHGARFVGTKSQVDRYFNHPARDFGQTDEALRIRRDGDSNCVTYKGPKIDSSTKTRKEIEIPLGSGDTLTPFGTMLVELGFRETLTVSKRREVYELEEDGLPLEIAIDEVEGLGTFVEVEAAADEADFERVRAGVLNFAERFDLCVPERRSYLEMLFELST